MLFGCVVDVPFCQPCRYDRYRIRHAELEPGVRERHLDLGSGGMLAHFKDRCPNKISQEMNRVAQVL